MTSAENLDDAPRELPAEPEAIPRRLPETIGGKLTLALQLYFGNLLTISAVVLTVSIPVQLATDYLMGLGASEEVWLSGVTGLVFGPIIVGAVIWILGQRLKNSTVSYRSAMRAGFRDWLPIFAARLLAYLLILIGLIALIVPGLILSIRFILIDQVAAVENPGANVARMRSTQLVYGQTLLYLLVLALTWLLLAGEEVASSTVAELVPSPAAIGIMVFMKLLVGILGELITCVLTVFYFEAASRKPAFAFDRSRIADTVETRDRSKAEDNGSNLDEFDPSS